MVRKDVAVVLACVISAGSLGTMGGCGATVRTPSRILGSAQHAARYGDVQLAEQEYREYLDRRPEDVRARYEFGQVLMRQGNYEGAAKEFGAARYVQPLNDEYAAALAQAHAAGGNREDALGMLRARAQELNRSQDWRLLASTAAELGNVDDANLAYLMASRLDGGKSLDLQKEMARFYKGIGDEAGYLQRLRMAYWINPTDPEVVEAIRSAGQIPGPAFAVVPEGAIPLP